MKPIFPLAWFSIDLPSIDWDSADWSSVVIPILVCWITLFYTNRNSEKALKIQDSNHRENLELSEKKYQEQLAINNENERLSHLPYLYLIPKYKENRFESKMVKIDEPNIFSLPFDLINKGAGTAFSISLKYLRNNRESINNNTPTVALQPPLDNHHDFLGVREPIDTDVLPVDEQTEFYLYLSALNEKSESIEPRTNLKWEFEITFSDIQERKYSQRYTFFTSTNNSLIYRVNAEMPQLIDKTNEI